MKQKEKAYINPRQDAMATWIVQKILMGQMYMANWLQRMTACCPASLKKVLFFSLIIAGCCYAGYLLLMGISGKSITRIPLQNVRLPVILEETSPAVSSLSANDVKAIQRFKVVLDSMQRDSAGKRIADSLRKARPGMMDSIGAWQMNYQPIK